MTNQIGFSKVLLLCFALINAHSGWTEEKPNKYSAGATLYISNTLVASTFMPPHNRMPSFYSSFYLTPFYQTPALFSDKKIKFASELGINVEWLDSSKITAANPNRTPKVTDLAIRASIPKALNFNESGISLTPLLEVEIPTSAGSQNANRILTLTANVNATWSKWGLSVIYKPSISGYIHSVPYKSSLCTSSPSGDKNKSKVLPDGKCLVDDQQTLALLKNGFFLEYILGSHTFYGGVRTYHGFLRKPTIADMKANKSISFSTLGLIEYTYNLPTSFPLSLGAGLSSSHAAINSKGNFKFPFFDFESPSNSEFYIKFETSI